MLVPVALGCGTRRLWCPKVWKSSRSFVVVDKYSTELVRNAKFLKPVYIKNAPTVEKDT